MEGTLEILLRELGCTRWNSSDPFKHHYAWVELTRGRVDEVLLLPGVDVSKIVIDTADNENFMLLLTEPIIED